MELIIFSIIKLKASYKFFDKKFSECRYIGFYFSFSLSTDGKRIIILSIHQPRYSIYKLFDTITLLSRGKLVYHGTRDNCLPYFAALGKYQKH